MTQLEAARQGTITPEMQFVAQREDLDADPQPTWAAAELRDVRPARFMKQVVTMLLAITPPGFLNRGHLDLGEYARDPQRVGQLHHPQRLARARDGAERARLTRAEAEWREPGGIAVSQPSTHAMDKVGELTLHGVSVTQC